MTRKLTISIDDRVYDGLHAIIGKGNIGKFLEDLARPLKPIPKPPSIMTILVKLVMFRRFWDRLLVVTDSLSAAYTEMTADRDREAEADEWCEALAGDGLDAPR